MPNLTPSAVRKQIADGAPDPVYLLLGEDEVETSALAAEFADLVDEGLRAFNVERIHAGDMTTGDKLADGVADLVSAVRTMITAATMSITTKAPAAMPMVRKIFACLLISTPPACTRSTDPSDPTP